MDTSAILAVLDADEALHARARDAWAELLHGDQDLLSFSYVLVESFALVQHRLGLEAARSLAQDVAPVVRIHWVDQVTHEEAGGALLIAGRRRLSLVDCVNFVTMRRLGVRSAFAFDRHCAEEGFQLVA